MGICTLRDKALERGRALRESARTFNLVESVSTFRKSNKFIVLIVFIAIFLDNMLMTTVVPIIPSFLYKKEHAVEYDLLSSAVSLRSENQKYCFRSYGNESVPRNSSTDWIILRNISDISANLYVASADQNCTELNVAHLERRKHRILQNENLRVGLLFASKATVQFVVNPFIGPLTNRIGYTIPMFTGFAVLFVTTIVFAFGTNYWVLLVARAFQGAGSSCSSVSGMGMIAEKYQDDQSRGNAMAIALSGLALGVLVGPSFGGVMYEFLGKEAPFLMLAGLALLDGVLQLTAMKPQVSRETLQGAGLKDLITDPYILLAAGSITFANMGIAMLEPMLPIWMFDTMNASNWQQGAAFLPASIAYLIGTNVFGPLAFKLGRWLTAMIGMAVVGICLFLIPFSTRFEHLIAPNLFMGFAIGMVDSSMMPAMGYLVDLRHVSVYGSVYAIADVAFCIGYAVGPAFGGSVVKTIGFTWMLWIIAVLNIAYAPLLYFLRSPPGNAEKIQLVMNDKCSIRYVSHRQSQCDSDDDFLASPEEISLQQKTQAGDREMVP